MKFTSFHKVWFVRWWFSKGQSENDRYTSWTQIADELLECSLPKIWSLERPNVLAKWSTVRSINSTQNWHALDRSIVGLDSSPCQNQLVHDGSCRLFTIFNGQNQSTPGLLMAFRPEPRSWPNKPRLPSWHLWTVGVTAAMPGRLIFHWILPVTLEFHLQSDDPPRSTCSADRRSSNEHYITLPKDSHNPDIWHLSITQMYPLDPLSKSPLQLKRT